MVLPNGLLCTASQYVTLWPQTSQKNIIDALVIKGRLGQKQTRDRKLLILQKRKAGHPLARANWCFVLHRKKLTFLLTYLLTYLLNFLLTFLLTPCSTVLLEKLTGLQLVKKFPAFYGTRKFITTFTSARHLPLL
jgi:hypothetical protein